MKYEKSILDAHDLQVFIISFFKKRGQKKELDGKTCVLGFGVRRVIG